MTIEGDLDPSVAAYDRELVPWLFEHWAEPMVDLIAPEPSSHIVDLGCGSGLIIRHLLGRLGGTGRVHGIDFDPAMLAYAAATIQDGRVSWHDADAAQLPISSSSMDRVSCHQALQFFPDRLAALSEIRRVLKPGGRLAVATWGRPEGNPWPAALSRAVGRMFGREASAAMSVVCDLGDPDSLGELLRQAGFEEVEVNTREQPVTHRNGREAAAGQLSALPSGSAIGEISREQHTELVDIMCEALADHLDTDGRLEMTSSCNMACGVNPTRTD